MLEVINNMEIVEIKELNTSEDEEIKSKISNLMTECLIEEYGPPPDITYIDRLLEYYYEREDSQIIYVLENNVFAGFLWIIETDDVISQEKFGLYLYIAVKEEFRGKKYSKKLMERAKELCKERGMKQVRLTVRSENDRALNLYTSMGLKAYKIEMSQDI